MSEATKNPTWLGGETANLRKSVLSSFFKAKLPILHDRSGIIFTRTFK